MTFTHKINLRVSPGMIFGDWAFLNKTTRLATAKALAGVEVAAISNIRILDMEAILPKVSLKVILNLAGRLVKRLLTDSQSVRRSTIFKRDFKNADYNGLRSCSR